MLVSVRTHLEECTYLVGISEAGGTVGAASSSGMAVVNGPDSCLEPPFLSLLRSRWTYFAKLDDLLLPSSGRSGAGDDMIVGLMLCRGDGGLFFFVD